MIGLNKPDSGFEHDPDPKGRASAKWDRFSDQIMLRQESGRG
jgi:hypothetical protein